MRKSVLLFLLAITATFTACKKDDPKVIDEENGGIITPGGKTCLLNKIKYEDNEYSSLEYDNQKRVTKISWFEGTTSESYATITYSANQIVYKEYDPSSSVPDVTTYTVTDGKITGSTENNSYISAGITYSSVNNEAYEYNADGYLTKITYTGSQSSNAPGNVTTNYSSVETYTYQNGNMIKAVYVSNGITYTSNYEYYTDILNTVTVDDEGIVIGKPNKNAVKKETETSSSPGSSTYISNFSYEVNSDKLITKVTETEGTDVYVKEYTYSCN